jgi:DMSO/TMAO reductase YedYZ molybdopterin-dependent catalytic subunit
MKRGNLIRIWLLFGIFLVSCSAAPKNDWGLTVSGSVNNPYSVTYEELTKMPQLMLDDVFMDKSVGDDETGSWSGVALDELFSKAEADPDFMTVTAIAADGYAIEISKVELSSGFVALKENGEWISKSDPEHGPIRLVCPETPANRWVFQLIELHVNK